MRRSFAPADRGAGGEAPVETPPTPEPEPPVDAPKPGGPPVDEPAETPPVDEPPRDPEPVQDPPRDRENDRGALVIGPFAVRATPSARGDR